MRIDTHDVAVHTNTAAYTQEVISTGPESPDSPNWSATQHADESGKLESHANTRSTPNVCGEERGDANKSRRPANVSVTSGLSASGIEPRMGDQKGPGTKGRLDTRAHAERCGQLK